MKQIVSYSVFACIIVLFSACSGFYGQNQTTANQAVEPVRSVPNDLAPIEDNIVYFVETRLSAKEYSWYPLLENHCQIGMVSFEADEFPVSVLYAGKTVFIESEVRDEETLKRISAEIIKKFGLRLKQTEDQGARLQLRTTAKNPITYQNVLKAIYGFFVKKYDEVNLRVTCNNLPKWVVDAFRPDFDRQIGKKPQSIEPASQPVKVPKKRQRRPRRNPRKRAAQPKK